MARSKRIPDYKRDVGELEAHLKKELRADMDAGYKEGIDVTVKRDAIIKTDKEHLDSLDEKTKFGLETATGERKQVMKKLSGNIHGSY